MASFLIASILRTWRPYRPSSRETSTMNSPKRPIPRNPIKRTTIIGGTRYEDRCIWGSCFRAPYTVRPDSLSHLRRAGRARDIFAEHGRALSDRLRQRWDHRQPQQVVYHRGGGKKASSDSHDEADTRAGTAE